MNDGSSVLRRSQGLQAPWERRLLIGTLVFVPIAYAIIALYIRVSIDRDSAWGLLVLDAMRHGGSFKLFRFPGPSQHRKRPPDVSYEVVTRPVSVPRPF